MSLLKSYKKKEDNKMFDKDVTADYSAEKSSTL